MTIKFIRSTKLFLCGAISVGALALAPSALAEGGKSLTQTERDDLSLAVTTYLSTNFRGDGEGGFRKSWAKHAGHHGLEGSEEIVERAMAGKSTAADIELMRGTGFFRISRSEVKQITQAALRSNAGRMTWNKRHADRLNLVIPNVAELPHLRPSLKEKLKAAGGVVGVSLNDQGTEVVLDRGIKVVLGVDGADISTARLSLVTVYAVAASERDSKEVSPASSPTRTSPRRCSGGFNPKRQQWPALPAKTPSTGAPQRSCLVAASTTTPKTPRPSTPTAAEVEAELRELVGGGQIESWEQLAVGFEVKEERVNKFRQALDKGADFRPRGNK